MSGSYTLGFDVSTQSMSAVVLDAAATPATVVAEVSIPYRDDPRLNRYGIDFETLLVPPRVAGEADQPPEMFLAALDAAFADLSAKGVDLSRIAAISVSAQQHGHVYLNDAGSAAIAALETPVGAGTSGDSDNGASSRSVGDGVARGGDNWGDLVGRFRGAFAYGTAPIWQTADSQSDADDIRQAVGGTERVVELSGSDSPARFTGAVVRRTARRFPDAWAQTVRVHLLSSFISGVLSANPDCPIDWGNGAGMTLMDYRRREWSSTLLDAVGADVAERLPGLASPVTVAGTIAKYFVERYGVSPHCLVNIGSGDNPQSKVMIDGDLLSLGSSFVYMVDTGEPVVDLQGYANSMYDGLGRPFVFACRTNGAMVWDRLRGLYGADFDTAERALETAAPGGSVAVWQPYAESYPVAPPIDEPAIRDGSVAFNEAYPAVVDSALVLTRHYARGFERGSGALALTGGPATSAAIQKRVASLFERPVVVTGSSGAALGSALSAWRTVLAEMGARDPDAEMSRIRREVVPPERTVEPDPEIVSAYQRVAPEIVAAFESAAGW